MSWLDGLGGVLHHRAGVDVELGVAVGRPDLVQALDQLGPAPLEQGQAGLGGR